MKTKYRIPLFDLNFDNAEEKAVVNTLRERWISAGPKTSEFENKFASILKASYAVAMANCTAALHLAVKLTGVMPGDEVICPSLTFVATANAVHYVNAKPVFADIKSHEDLTIDPQEIEKKITKKTKAVIVMHYGGFACDMERIMAIAKKFGLKVIEDACHGPMSEYKGRKLGTIGDVGCFSFFSNKNISTGEGGMLVTNNSQYYERAKLLRSHGIPILSYDRAGGDNASYDIRELGYNYRMDDIRASIGLAQLKKLEMDIRKRIKIRKAYIESLGSIDEIIIPFKDYKELSSNYIFPVVLKYSVAKKRDEIRDRLASAGIQTSVHYPAIHKFSINKKFFSKLPKTDYVSDNLITLPLYGNLKIESVKYICNSIKRALNEVR